MQSNDASSPVSDRPSSHDVGVLVTTPQKNQASPDRDSFTDMPDSEEIEEEMCLDMWDPKSAKAVMESIGRWLDKCKTSGTTSSHDVVWDLYVDEYVALFFS
jgi:hypothetical protein